MKTTNASRRRIPLLILLAFLLCPWAGSVRADVPAPGPSSHNWLDRWSFGNTNTWLSDLTNAPVSFTNLDVSKLGNGNALLLDRTNAAWLKYNVFESDGATNLTVNNGTVMFWFAPAWSGTNQGGTGPGQWGRLIEVGSYTTNAVYGWWSLYLDPDGANIYFSAQTNSGSGATYLSAPITWTNEYWHCIVLTYAATNTALYLDGQLATNGSGMTFWPGSDVLSNGFYIGSDSSGTFQARGIFDDWETYNFALDSATISNRFNTDLFYYLLNPYNAHSFRISSGTSSPSSTVYRAITGQGSLQFSGAASTCSTSATIWITNTVATVVGSNPTNQSVTFTFDLAGGSNSLAYDVFATSALDGSSITNGQWLWIGQGYHCNTYTITNLPGTAAYLILGTPKDSDGDGLTDAYEELVSHTRPDLADTDGDGIPDGWEVLLGLSPLGNNNAQSNYTYDPVNWLKEISGARTGSVGLDNEGNALSVSQ